MRAWKTWVCLISAIGCAAEPTAPPKPPRTMVLLITGQSNAGSYGTGPLVSVPNAWDFTNGALVPAADPLPGTDGLGASIWTRLADSILHRGLADSVVLVPVTLSSQYAAAWLPGQPLGDRFYQTARTLVASSYVPTQVLWAQGESDGRYGTDSATYDRELRMIVTALRATGVRAPMYVGRTTHCVEAPPSVAVRGAITAVVRADTSLRDGADTDQLDDSYRRDGCHLNPQGQNVAAGLWLRAITNAR